MPCGQETSFVKFQNSLVTQNECYFGSLCFQRYGAQVLQTSFITFILPVRLHPQLHIFRMWKAQFQKFQPLSRCICDWRCSVSLTAYIVIPQYLRDWFQHPFKITKSIDAQVPYVKWYSTLSPPYPWADTGDDYTETQKRGLAIMENKLVTHIIIGAVSRFFFVDQGISVDPVPTILVCVPVKEDEEITHNTWIHME